MKWLFVLFIGSLLLFACTQPSGTNTSANLTSVAVKQMGSTQEIDTQTDDNGWYPKAITAKANVPLVIHNTERTQNVYFAGASVSADNVPAIEFKVGESKDVKFTPTQSMCLGEYWPSTGVLKGYLHITVEGQSAPTC